MARTVSPPWRGGATLGPDETAASWEVPHCIVQDWDPFPIPPPCEELWVAFDLEEAGLQRSRALWTVPLPRGLRPIKVSRPHVSASRVPWSLLQSVFQANVKTQVSSHLLCWDPHLGVNSGVTTACGPAQRGWPEKSPQSFPVNASWRGQAGVLRGGKAQAPATLVLEL